MLQMKSLRDIQTQTFIRQLDSHARSWREKFELNIQIGLVSCGLCDGKGLQPRFPDLEKVCEHGFPGSKPHWFLLDRSGVVAQIMHG